MERTVTAPWSPHSSGALWEGGRIPPVPQKRREVAEMSQFGTGLAAGRGQARGVGEPPLGSVGLGSPIPPPPGGRRRWPERERPPQLLTRTVAGLGRGGRNTPANRAARPGHTGAAFRPASRPHAVPAFCSDRGWISPPAATYQRCSARAGGCAPETNVPDALLLSTWVFY